MITSILDPQLSSCADLEAIVCMESCDLREQLVDELLNQDCKVYLAKSAEDAIAKLQFHSFHIVVFQAGYSMEIMQLLACLPMVVRRNIFYVLVGDSFESANAMQAFILSANLVINGTDITSFAGILSDALLNNNRFFRPFYYALAATNKIAGA